MLKKIKILNDKVFIYSKADLKSSIIGILKKDEIIVQIKKIYVIGNIWRKVRLFKQNGYICDNNVFEFCSSYNKLGKITVYSQPSNDSRVLKIFKNGKSFTISEELKDWYEIRFYNSIEEIGYVEKNKIKIRKSYLDLGWLRDIDIDQTTIWSFLGIALFLFVLYEIVPNFNGRIQYLLSIIGIFIVYYIIEKIIRKNV